MKKALSKIKFREYGVVIGFVLLCMAISIATPAFMSQKNLLNLLRQSSIIGFCRYDICNYFRKL